MPVRDKIEPGRIAIVQAPGGTRGPFAGGGRFFWQASVHPIGLFLPNPRANHAAILQSAGLTVEMYSYLGAIDAGLDSIR